MRLTVVGCSGSYPGPDSPASCYLVEHDGFRILVDLGNGALGPLQRFADLDSIDAVLLSHLHADHCLDLCSFHVYRRWHPDGPRPRIPVIGPAGTATRMAAAYGLPEQPGMSREFEFVDWQAHQRVGPFDVTTATMAHPVACMGMRIEAGGRTLAYSADTGPTPALVELAVDADVALFEASFLGTANPPDLHLTARDAAQAAERAGAGLLLLTHLVPWNSRDDTWAEARPAYAGDLALAEPGMVIDI